MRWRGRGEPGATALGAPVGDAPWPRVADFAVPALLAAIQITGSWAMAAGLDIELSRLRWMGLVAGVVLGCAALIWRRTAPVPVLGAVVACSAIALLAAGTAEMPVAGMADGVALYSLAVQRNRRTATIGAVVTGVMAVAVILPFLHGPAEIALNVTLGVLYYVLIIALGQLRRQHNRRRRALAAQLAEAGRAAAGVERERLARDLHDVAGHHLSAVVVHSGAVSRLADPALTREALAAAADTGRDVRAALGRLVDDMGANEEAGLDEVPALCEGLTRLGIPVFPSVEGRARRLRPGVGAAAYRIVQESLTNAMRYAAGSPVRVEIRYRCEAVEVEVVNEAPYDRPVSDLGTGRGIAGMRDRATALGGTLTAGPVDGGWSVHAVLPTASRRRRMGWPEVLDATVVALCGALPALIAFSPPEPILGGWSPGPAALVVALLLARAAPLWWRRRKPLRVLAAVAATDTALALLAAAHSPGLLALLAIGGPVEMVAVYAVGGHAPRGARTWPAPLVGAVPWALAFALAGLHAADGDPAAAVIAFSLPVGLLSGVLVLLPFWAWGRAVTGRGLQWEATALETMAARQGEAARAERHRVALALRGTVLDHTARLVRAAEAGLAGTDDEAKAALDAVSDQARAAMLDMRALLDALHPKM
ncbi:sensor histidine kinase [Spirillospora albida]|uniref:sensor histidine kinase n=1 Tax=Spirillospora albida TaxID=58123 RepID=UPI0004BEC02F|nr:histidine kinase [Spirillospora albida]